MQAKQYAHRVGRLLESDAALVGEPGTPFQGKLAFPWGYGVVLANISRKAFAGTQEQLARSMGEGHRVIHGVAGSGKTMILGYRAQYGAVPGDEGHDFDELPQYGPDHGGRLRVRARPALDQGSLGGRPPSSCIYCQYLIASHSYDSIRESALCLRTCSMKRRPPK